MIVFQCIKCIVIWKQRYKTFSRISLAINLFNSFISGHSYFMRFQNPKQMHLQNIYSAPALIRARASKFGNRWLRGQFFFFLFLFWRSNQQIPIRDFFINIQLYTETRRGEYTSFNNNINCIIAVRLYFLNLFYDRTCAFSNYLTRALATRSEVVLTCAYYYLRQVFLQYVPHNDFNFKFSVGQVTLPE